MKGYVSHLITENEKLEQELTADYDAAHAPVSHQQLLALQLRGDIDELSVCIHDCVSLVPMVKDLPADLLEEARPASLPVGERDQRRAETVYL